MVILLPCYVVKNIQNRKKSISLATFGYYTPYGYHMGPLYPTIVTAPLTASMSILAKSTELCNINTEYIFRFGSTFQHLSVKRWAAIAFGSNTLALLSDCICQLASFMINWRLTPESCLHPGELRCDSAIFPNKSFWNARQSQSLNTIHFKRSRGRAKRDRSEATLNFFCLSNPIFS